MRTFGVGNIPDEPGIFYRPIVATGERRRLERKPFIRAIRPSQTKIDFDRFKNVNNSFGLVVGDSMLLAKMPDQTPGHSQQHAVTDDQTE